MVVAAASLVESPPVHQYGVKHMCLAKLMDTGFIPGYVWVPSAIIVLATSKVVALPSGLSASSPAPKCTRTTASVKGKGKVHTEPMEEDDEVAKVLGPANATESKDGPMSDTILGLWPKLWNPHNHGMVLIWPMLEVSWCVLHSSGLIDPDAGGLDETTYALHTKIKEVTALFTEVDWFIEFPEVAGGLCDCLIRHSATLCHAQAEVIEQCVNECLFADRIPDLYEIVLVMIHKMHDSGKISISDLKWHQCHLFIARQEDVLLRDDLRGLFLAVGKDSR
ncbi:hypothetical protein BJY52DRAFT_1228310 [Lactarius psammicola]|nr:hypothetical protein BJY52DRAFT_1228310 [Lactarius psammicola]